MQFRIADTFTQSLARLTDQEQRAVKNTAFDLQIDPSGAGMSFHKLDKARDKNFWSVRVNADIRLIVHKTPGSLLLCYVGHHDAAYAWGERRKLETHPTTGAAQLVEIRETVQEIVVPLYVEAPAQPASLAPCLRHVSEQMLLSYGVPPEWLADVKAATEDSLLVLTDHLPAEAAEALLELAIGGQPRPMQPAADSINPFEHPDARRRFRVMSNVEELERALDFPWEKWTVFLHPDQQLLVEREYSGPARVSGSAGTGKTIVALHRAVHLARAHPDARVLLTTFSNALANALQTRLQYLVNNEPKLAERIDIYSIDAIGKRLYKSRFGPVKIATHDQIVELVDAAAQSVADHKFSRHFLVDEWTQIVDAWQLETWEAYRDVPRLGRKTRLPEAQRALLWSIFAQVRNELQTRQLLTRAGLFDALATAMTSSQNPPFDFVVVDEAQDMNVAHLKFFAALGQHNPQALFFAGDLGQRIFQQAFSWRALGVDIRGRSRTLRVNYRTSHQIRQQADRLLSTQVSDADGNLEDRSDTISAFNGAAPLVRVLADEEQETAAVAQWLQVQIRDGVPPHECAIFVRSAAELQRAVDAAMQAKLDFKVLDETVVTSENHVAVSTMHLAKGLEFRAVAVMACDDEVIPSQNRIETAGDESDLREVYDTERHLLYVACTRARDHLLVTGISPCSEFLDDMKMTDRK